MPPPSSLLGVACLALLMVPSSSFVPTFRTTFPALRLRAASLRLRSSHTPLLMSGFDGGFPSGNRNPDGFSMDNPEDVATDGDMDNYADQLKRNLDAYGDPCIENPEDLNNLDNREKKIKPNKDAYRGMDKTVEVDPDDDSEESNPHTPTPHARSSPW
ncbi:hypothetical protein T484DRAFT_1792123 [Baffinella frigidus]|nr:hypothetical protein T484DRAFT_1792123 [Cryptophyta sp. CCMP2293]